MFISVHLLLFHQNGSNPSICKPQKLLTLDLCLHICHVARCWCSFNNGGGPDLNSSNARAASFMMSAWPTRDRRDLACQILLLRNLRAEKSRGSKLTLLPPRKIMKNLFHLVHLYVILPDLRVCFRNFPTQIFASSTHIYHSLPWSLPWSLTPFAWKRCRVWSRAGDLQWKYLHAEDDKRPLHHGCSTKTQSINIIQYLYVLYIISKYIHLQYILLVPQQSY